MRMPCSRTARGFCLLALTAADKCFDIQAEMLGISAKSFYSQTMFDEGIALLEEIYTHLWRMGLQTCLSGVVSEVARLAETGRDLEGKTMGFSDADNLRSYVRDSENPSLYWFAGCQLASQTMSTIIEADIEVKAALYQAEGY
jgi:hypothetical protein